MCHSRAQRSQWQHGLLLTVTLLPLERKTERDTQVCLCHVTAVGTLWVTSYISNRLLNSWGCRWSRDQREWDWGNPPQLGELGWISLGNYKARYTTFVLDFIFRYGAIGIAGHRGAEGELLMWQRIVSVWGSVRGGGGVLGFVRGVHFNNPYSSCGH